MKIFGRIAVILLIVLVVAGVLAYADGASLPVNHSVSVTGTVQAPPEKVFAIIANVAKRRFLASRRQVRHRPRTGQRSRPLD